MRTGTWFVKGGQAECARAQQLPGDARCTAAARHATSAPTVCPSLASLPPRQPGELAKRLRGEYEPSDSEEEEMSVADPSASEIEVSMVSHAAPRCATLRPAAPCCAPLCHTAPCCNPRRHAVPSLHGHGQPHVPALLFPCSRRGTAAQDVRARVLLRPALPGSPSPAAPPLALPVAAGGVLRHCALPPQACRRGGRALRRWPRHAAGVCMSPWQLAVADERG